MFGLMEIIGVGVRFDVREEPSSLWCGWVKDGRRGEGVRCDRVTENMTGSRKQEAWAMSPWS